VVPNGAIGARFSADGETLYLTDVTGLAIYDASNPASPQIRSHLPLPRIHADGAMHLVDVSDPGAPRIVVTRPAPGDLLGGPVGFYVSTARFWGAYLAPADCPPLGSRGRTAERVPLSPIGESGRSASWGRGPAPSPRALA
jgi:LVIVD repeat-containing protein